MEALLQLNISVVSQGRYVPHISLVIQQKVEFHGINHAMISENGDAT